MSSTESRQTCLRGTGYGISNTEGPAVTRESRSQAHQGPALSPSTRPWDRVTGPCWACGQALWPRLELLCAGGASGPQGFSIPWCSEQSEGSHGASSSWGGKPSKGWNVNLRPQGWERVLTRTSMNEWSRPHRGARDSQPSSPPALALTFHGARTDRCMVPPQVLQWDPAGRPRLSFCGHPRCEQNQHPPEVQSRDLEAPRLPAFHPLQSPQTQLLAAGLLLLLPSLSPLARSVAQNV